jgi:hypothetical protein
MTGHCRFLYLLAALGCAGRTAPTTRAIAPATAALGPDTCPPMTPTDQDTAAVHLGEDATRDGLYITYLVDGQVALRNQPNRRRTSSEAAGFGSGPDLDPADIQSVEILKPLAAQRAYGTCPGVALILITTKSKTWHPNPDRQ